MEYSSSYADLADAPPHASLLALLPDGGSAETITETERRLRAAGIDVELCGDRTIRGSRWELAVAGGARVWLEPTPRDAILEEIRWPGVGDDELEMARTSTWSIGVSGSLFSRAAWPAGTRLPLGAGADGADGDDGDAETLRQHAPLRGYQWLARILHAAAPDAGLVFDLDSLVPRSGRWLAELAESDTPPSPTELYTIHSVIDDDGPGQTAWLHTHGLNRCGIIELDMLAVPADDVAVCGRLLNTVASLFLQDQPPRNEPFSAGESAGDPIELVWLPWEEGVLKVARGASGGRRDRREGHGGARGVLFSRRPGLFRAKYQSPSIYADALESNPLLFVSTAETERRARLAQERFDRFRRVYERFATRDDWMLLVKLGYEVDGAREATDREHLWFRVHDIDPAHEGGEVEGTLLNQPYHIASMVEGERRRHSLSLLSEWTILCEHGRFDPDSIGELERILDVPSVPDVPDTPDPARPALRAMTTSSELDSSSPV